MKSYLLGVLFLGTTFVCHADSVIKYSLRDIGNSDKEVGVLEISASLDSPKSGEIRSVVGVLRERIPGGHVRVAKLAGKMEFFDLDGKIVPFSIHLTDVEAKIHMDLNVNFHDPRYGSFSLEENRDGGSVLVYDRNLYKVIN